MPRPMTRENEKRPELRHFAMKHLRDLLIGALTLAPKLKPLVLTSAILAALCLCGNADAEPMLAKEDQSRSDLSAADLARVKSVIAEATDFSKAEPFERKSGGAATTDKTANRDIFSQFSANLSFEQQRCGRPTHIVEIRLRPPRRDQLGDAMFEVTLVALEGGVLVLKSVRGVDRDLPLRVSREVFDEVAC